MRWAELNQQAHTGAVSLARPNGLIPPSSQGRAGDFPYRSSAEYGVDSSSQLVTTPQDLGTLGSDIDPASMGSASHSILQTTPALETDQPILREPGQLPMVRYRGFVLIPQADLTWLIRPERSPMTILPFRAPVSSLTDVKALVDWRLAQL